MISEANRRRPAFVAIGLPSGRAGLPRLARRLGLLRLSLSPAVLAFGTCDCFGSCRSALVALAARRTCVRRGGFGNRGLLRRYRSRRPWRRRAISARAFLGQ